MISHEYLLSRIKYNPETGEFVWLKKIEDTHFDKIWNTKYAGKVAGNINQNGYQRISLLKKEYQSSHLAIFYTTKLWPPDEVDHINLNSGDNRIINLRIANRSENAINRRIQSNNTTGFKGVWKRKNKNKWVAEISKKGKRVNLGDFESPELAYEAYKMEAQKIHREFARL